MPILLGTADHSGRERREEKRGEGRADGIILMQIINNQINPCIMTRVSLGTELRKNTAVFPGSKSEGNVIKSAPKLAFFHFFSFLFYFFFLICFILGVEQCGRAKTENCSAWSQLLCLRDFCQHLTSRVTKCSHCRGLVFVICIHMSLKQRGMIMD